MWHLATESREFAIQASEVRGLSRRNYEHVPTFRVCAHARPLKVVPLISVSSRNGQGLDSSQVYGDEDLSIRSIGIHVSCVVMHMMHHSRMKCSTKELWK